MIYIICICLAIDLCNVCRQNKVSKTVSNHHTKPMRHGMYVCWIHSQFNTLALWRRETSGNVKKGMKKRKENDCIIWWFGSPPSARHSPQAGARAALDELIRHRGTKVLNLSFYIFGNEWVARNLLKISSSIWLGLIRYQYLAGQVTTEFFIIAAIELYT